MTIVNQQSVVYGRLHIKQIAGQSLPSAQILEALRRSFRRLAEALCLEFTRELGPGFRLVHLNETLRPEGEQEYSVLLELKIESAAPVAGAVAYHWMISAGSWVQKMTQAFPELRGTTSVAVERATPLVSSPAAGDKSPRAA